MITPQLIHAILGQMALPLDGEHGVAHWARVLENGRWLAWSTGAHLPVVELFAVFHDARRLADGDDPLHGRRAADLCADLRGALFELDDEDFVLLWDACAFHADGRFDHRVTVQTCWDADRLDYGRGDVELDPQYLGTLAARSPVMTAWATGRARRCELPGLVLSEWAIPALAGASRQE